MVLLASDIGSTTTKVIAFEFTGGVLSVLGSLQEPTTVEPPFSDVTVGLFRAFQKLSIQTGLDLVKGNSVCVPYYTTSSAGGGLQVLVVGYTTADSCRIAKTTAFSAGAVISGAFSINSEKNRLTLMDRMSRLNPDLVLMAGGTDGGALSGVVTMAYLLNHARPEPKYGSKMPLLYCGNVRAREFVQETLESHFVMSSTENVIPGNNEINLRPAINSVQNIFLEHVMRKAPGYNRVTDIVSAPVVPTPVGVSGILAALASETGSDVLMADMGGATTDIFSSVSGEMRRTVAANTGMSYSMSNTLSEAGIESVIRHLPGLPEETIRRWCYGKSLFPTTIPGCEDTELLEVAVAVEGLRMAWKHHQEVGYNPGRPSISDLLKLRKAASGNLRLETLSGKQFYMDSYTRLIGAGGVFSHAPRTRAAWLLAEAFRPPGITTLYVDTHFRSPHLGAMLGTYPEEALTCYISDCLQPVCRVLSPAWSLTGVFAEVKGPHGRKTVWTGSWLYLPDTKDCTVRVFGPAISGVDRICDGMPLLIDCRRDNSPLPIDFRKGSEITGKNIRFPLRETSSPELEEVQFSLSLPFSGEICVEPGQHVNPGDCLGRITEIPPRHFAFDVYNSRSCSTEIPASEITAAILVKPGQKISRGDTLLDYSYGNYRAFYEAPVGGTVTKVVPPGVIMVVEDMQHDTLAHVVQVARKMYIKPKQMKQYLRVTVGDWVYRGAIIANDPPVSICQAPCPGYITDIDHSLGTVTIHYNLSPITINSPLAGTVTGTDGRREVGVSSLCFKLQGVLGFGKTVRGRLSALNTAARRNDIVFLNSAPGKKDLERTAEIGAAGLVCPSIQGNVLFSWLGREPGLFITGNEDVPFSLLILQGIGVSSLTDSTSAAIARRFGSSSALLPVTKIRAGVTRPFLAIAP